MPDLTDHGPNPYVIDIEDTTVENTNFRATLWTGAHLQLTVMSIPPGGDIGLEAHMGNDQFLRVEQGTGRVEMGPTETEVTFTAQVQPDWAVFVPAGTWHNITNTGSDDLRLYTLYGPPDHAPGTLHPTQHDAEQDPHEH
ncbi:MAG: cupin domain-containing protein [Micrococcales bacterium]|nr:cupin domain-containing protein [Micrococcales bacterium]MCL2667924.1 cupin domain-containing protein [Micrococcales bacterium]